MSTDITQQSVWYVRFDDGNKPSRVRKWPQASPGTADLPEGPIVGRALELSALLLLGVEQDSVQVGVRTRIFHNPHTDDDGRVWRYVRAYDGTKKLVVSGWAAANEGAQVYLDELQPVESCNAASTTEPGMRWRPSNLKANMEAYVVTHEGLKVRAGPGCNNTADHVGLAPGAVIKVLEGPRCSADGRVWWRIKHSGNDRWVCESEPAGTTCDNTPANADDSPLEWNLLPLRVAL